MILRYGSGTGKLIETVIVDDNRCFSFYFYYFEANA